MAQYEIEVILLRQLASYLATSRCPSSSLDSRGTLAFYNEPAEIILGKRFDETGEMSGNRALKPTGACPACHVIDDCRAAGHPIPDGAIDLAASNDRRH